MKLTLPNSSMHSKIVEVNIGDYVKIDEYDNISVTGKVFRLTDTQIFLNKGTFLGGCYEECNYDDYEEKEDFSFYFDSICSLNVGTFESFSPLQLLNKSVKSNYCGSEKIIMSNEYAAWYKEYINHEEEFLSYLGLEIEVNEELPGYYVFAVPNEKSKKHKITPYLSYKLHVMKDKKLMVTSVFSSFEDELRDSINISLNKTMKKLSLDTCSFKLEHNGEFLMTGNKSNK